MTSEPRFWAVIMIGPPGAGKDTQSELLSSELGLAEIKTSKIIEDKFKNSPDDPVIKVQKERKLKGELVDSGLVQQWVIEKLKQAADQHLGIIFSGSPRTTDEAITELPILESFYTKEFIKVIYIKVGEEESVKRNTFRRVCEANNHPIPNLPEYKDLTICPKDRSPIITRQDDTPETTRNRYQVFLDQTSPILDWYSEKGYNILEVNGEQSIEEVHRDILNKLYDTPEKRQGDQSDAGGWPNSQ